MSESDISEDLRDFILTMARLDDVNSVSCQFRDFALWEGLLAEQMRRVELTNKPPRDAFFLCGPDGGIFGVARLHPGLEDLPREKWFKGDTLEERVGGDIHIPYEGVCGADLFVYPGWKKIHPEAWKAEGAELDWATAQNNCNYLLIDRDLGETDCAKRISPVEGWWLYSSTAAYKDCHPFHSDLYSNVQR